MADPWRFSVSVAGAVVNEEGKFLAIQRRDNGHWEPPGGLVEPGETITQTLVREVEEETGLRVSPGPLSGVYQNISRDIAALVFQCTVESGELRISAESIAVEWLTAEEVQDRMEEAYAVRLLDALEATARVRVHDGHQLIDVPGPLS